MSDDSDDIAHLTRSASVPRTGVIYVTTEAAQAAASRRAIPTGATSARASPRPASCRARRRACTTSTIDVDDQEYAPVAGLWELREAIAALYNRLYRRGHAVAVHRRERLRLGRRARRAHARRGQPRAHQPRPLPARLHRVRGAARHLQGVHRHPDPARGRARLRLHRRRSAPRDPRAAACRRCCCRTRATRPASWSQGEELARWVRRRARARLHAAARRVLLALHLDRGRPGALPVESAARYVEDVDRDPVRALRRAHQELALPRLARHLDGRADAASSTRVASAGSFLDGGGSQAAAARGDSAARRRRTSSPRPTRSTTAFREKRDRMLLAASSASACASTARPTARSTSGATSPACRRRSTTAWASSAPRSTQKVITVPGRVLRREPGQAPPRPRARASATTCASRSARRWRCSRPRSSRLEELVAEAGGRDEVKLRG